MWLQNKIANSTTATEKTKWETQYYDLIGSDNTEIIRGEIGGDENAIQPRTWQNDTTQVSDQPSEGDFREQFDIPKTKGGEVQETIQEGKPLEENQYQTWDTDMDVNKGVLGKIGDKEWIKDFEDPETAAKREWLENSANTPAAKAFAEGTDQQKKDWGNLRWEARKRHKKLFEYNTDKEK